MNVLLESFSPRIKTKCLILKVMLEKHRLYTAMTRTMEEMKGLDRHRRNKKKERTLQIKYRIPYTKLVVLVT
jgi:hypothetical protein